jgi:hypothetical protein
MDIDGNTRNTWLLYNETTGLIEPARVDPVTGALLIYGVTADGNSPTTYNRAGIDGNSRNTISLWNESIAIVATNTGAISPQTMADDATVGIVAWTNPDNAKVSDNVYATAVLTNNNVQSHWLKATNFGFSIPSGSTITGIVIEGEYKNSTNDNCYMNAKMYKTGSLIGTLKQLLTQNTSEAYRNLYAAGGTTYLWGTSWTADDINNSGFGVGFSSFAATGTGYTVSVDHIRITVYYTTAGTTTNFIESARCGSNGELLVKAV